MKIINQHGTALISALLIMAIAALLATATMVSLRLLIHQASLNIDSDQMYEYLLGANGWAEMAISTNPDLKKVKSLNIIIGQAHISAKIYAQGGLFNLNSLEETNNTVSFVRLLRAVIPTMPPDKATALAQAVNAWLSSTGVNEDAYLQLNPPYRPGHRSFAVTSELRMVLGMNASIYQALAPYIAAIPTTKNLIDINYAPIAVLLTLSDKITLSQAQTIHNCRDKQGYFKTQADFIKACGSELANVVGNINTEENYYLVHATATQGYQQLILTSLLSKYTDTNGKEKIKIVWQQLNTDS